MRLVVAFTVSGIRPRYLRAALESWYLARGVQEVRLLARHEPVPPLHYADLENGMKAAFADCSVVHNPEHLGCAGNTRRVLADAFRDGADFAILAEEDMVVASDVLEYFTWAAETYRDDHQVATVSGHAFSCKKPAHDAVVRRRWFNPQLWGTWKHEWETFVSHEWRGISGNEEAWDANLRQRFADTGMQSVFPLVSRVQHIGEVSTLTRPPLAEHFYQQFRSQCFEPAIPPQEYREVPDPGEALVV